MAMILVYCKDGQIDYTYIRTQHDGLYAGNYDSYGRLILYFIVFDPNTKRIRTINDAWFYSNFLELQAIKRKSKMPMKLRIKNKVISLIKRVLHKLDPSALANDLEYKSKNKGREWRK